MITAVVGMAVAQVCVIIWVAVKFNQVYTLFDLMEDTIQAQTEFDKQLVEKMNGNKEEDGRDSRRDNGRDAVGKEVT